MLSLSACPSWGSAALSGTHARPWVTDAWAPLVLGINVVAVLYCLGHWGALAGRVDASARVFAALVVVGTVFSGLGILPAALVAVVAGAAFGVVRGSALVFAAASAASFMGFAAARALGPESFARHVGRWDLVKLIHRLLAERGFAGLWLLRAAPVFPFALVHFILAQTPVRAAAFAASSFAMLPWILFCCYCGSVMSTAESLAGPSGESVFRVLAVVIAAIALTRVVARSACRALAAHEASETAHSLTIGGRSWHA